MKIKIRQLRQIISEELESREKEAQEEVHLPVSEFSPPEKTFYIYVVDKDDALYERFSSLFKADLFGHGFFIKGSNLIIIDGGIKDEPWFTRDHMKAIEAHEAAHGIAGHDQYGILQYEIEADEIAIELLNDKGYSRAAELLAARLEGMREEEAVPLQESIVFKNFNIRLPTQKIQCLGKSIVVEIARTPESRKDGLMNRMQLEKNSGMLFVFPTTDRQSFWMENTYIPLSIAFLNENGRILNIENMKPFDKVNKYSRGAAKFALEMNQGWFKRNGVTSGDVIEEILNLVEGVR